MTVKAPVNPEVMRWARETARLSIEEAAKKVGRSEEDLSGWEDGSLKPSMPQARDAARVYKRPLAVFYLPEPPKGWQVLRDFRTLPRDEPREYSSRLAFLIRETYSRQQWMREYLIDEECTPLEFVGTASTSSNPRKLASTIRQTIGVTDKSIRACRKNDAALNLWVEQAESAGIFVFREGSKRHRYDTEISGKEARGFVICDEYAPFIFLNSKDAKVAQIFTLAHELVHLWVSEQGISNLEQRGVAPDKESRNIETFCNRVAGLIVLDPDAFKERWQQVRETKSTEEAIDAAANYLKVSRVVVARRLLDGGLLSQAQYDSLDTQYEEDWLRFSEQQRRRNRESEGFPGPYVMKLIQNGKEYSRTVLGAFYSGSISARDTSGLLDVKVNNLSKLAEKAGVFPDVTRDSA